MKKIFLCLLMTLSGSVSAMDTPPPVPKRNIRSGVLQSDARIKAQLINLYGKTFTYINLRERGISDISQLGLNNEFILTKSQRIGHFEEITAEDMNADINSKMNFVKFEEINEDGENRIYKIYEKSLDISSLEYPLYLDVAHNNIKEFNADLPAHQIAILDLSYNPLESISEFGTCLPNLEILKVNNTEISVLPDLRTFASLRTLCIADTQIPKEDIKQRFVKTEETIGDHVRTKHDSQGDLIATCGESNNLLYLFFKDIVHEKYHFIANDQLYAQSKLMYSHVNIIPSIHKNPAQSGNVKYYCNLGKKELYNIDGIDTWNFRINDRGSEKVIVTLGELANLTLQMTENHICTLPVEFYNLAGVVDLRLDNNHINYLSKDISKLRNIETLLLDNNGLLDLPKELFELPLLEDLWISENNLIDLPELTSKDIQSKLSRVVLGNNPLKNTKRLLEYLNQLPALTKIECFELNDRRKIVGLSCPLEIDGQVLTPEEIQKRFAEIVDSKKQN